MRNFAISNDDNETSDYCFLSANEFMDDGSKIDLKIKIEKKTVFKMR